MLHLNWHTVQHERTIIVQQSLNVYSVMTAIILSHLTSTICCKSLGTGAIITFDVAFDEQYSESAVIALRGHLTGFLSLFWCTCTWTKYVTPPWWVLMCLLSPCQCWASLVDLLCHQTKDKSLLLLLANWNNAKQWIGYITLYILCVLYSVTGSFTECIDQFQSSWTYTGLSGHFSSIQFNSIQ